MRIHQFTIKQMLAAVFWLSLGMGCIAFVFRPSTISMHPNDDTWAIIDRIARLVAWIISGTFIGCGIGTLTKHPFWFTVAGTLISPVVLITMMMILL